MLKKVLARSLADYKGNPVFILPRLLELLVDLVILFFAGIVIAGLFLGSISYEVFTEPKLPFRTLALSFAALSVAGLLAMLANASVRAALIAMAVEAGEKGKTTLQKGWLGVKGYALRIFLYFIFLISSLGLLVMLPFSAGLIAGPLVALLFPFSIIAFLLLYFFTLFTPQQIVLRDSGVIDALKASAAFVRSSYLAVLGYGGVVLALSLGVGLFTSLIFFIINEITRYNPFLNLVAKIFHNILALAIGIVISPYFEIVKTYMVLQGEEDAGKSETTRAP
jgi:hypothetical protein